MNITQEWLKKELLKDKFYKDYRLAWFIAQKETESIKLIERLLQADVREEFDHRYNTPADAGSAALAYANWLLIRSMSNMELVDYTVYAVKQVLPYLKKDIPQVQQLSRRDRLIDKYYKAIATDSLAQIIYKKVAFDIVLHALPYLDNSAADNFYWFSYAANLAAYASVFAISKKSKAMRRLVGYCALNAVELVADNVSLKFEKDHMLRDIITYGLAMCKKGSRHKGFAVNNRLTAPILN